MAVPFANSKPTSVLGARLFVTLFFLFFFGMGSVFVWLVSREALAGVQTWTWVRTPCEITRCGVQETDARGQHTGDYYLDVAYRYNFKGQNFTSDRRRLKPAAFSDYGKVEQLAQTYQLNSPATCYVNPSNPAEAVLERGSLLFPLVILFPLVFVAIGAIGIYSAWRPTSVTSANTRPISDPRPGNFGKGFATIFFAVFISVGLLVFYIISVRPLSGVIRARQWPAVPCTIVSSEVRTHRGNRGSTYSVNILYSYVFNDHEYKANRYDFMGGSSSGFSGKQAVVGRYPPGEKATCYINPMSPAEAVLERGFTPMMWIGLLPLLFVFFGLIGLVSTLRKGRLENGPGAAGFQGIFTTKGANVLPALELLDPNAPIILKPRSSPLSKCVGALVAALFWNGIVSVFLFHLFKSWRRSGFFEWFLALFLSPFVLIGVGLLLATVYFFLGLFNPRPRLTVTPGAPRLGDSLKIQWDISGRVEALQDFKVWLEGREEATYTRGTRSATDRSVFARVEVTTLSVAHEMRSGSATVAVPAELMHSFTSQHNKIVWSILVSGQVPRWPDLQEEFAVTVLPAPRRPV